jgi:Xaa-Pro aminopeptidase
MGSQQIANAPGESLLSAAVVQAARVRSKRLQDSLAQHQVDALLISAEKDIHYLTGFVGHESLAMVTAADGAIIITDSRYDEYLQPWRDARPAARGGAAEVVLGIRHRLYDTVRDLCAKRNIKRLGVQADHITVAARAAVADKVGADRLSDTNGLVASLRMRKDAVEIAAIEKAIAIAQDSITAALDRLEPGLSENQFSAVLEYEMKWRGAAGSSFTPIIGSGANSSIIHHSTGHTAIREGVLLVDWGCLIDGYASDLTRTFGIGQLPAKLREVYKIVLDAQLAAIAAIRPGKTGAEIDAVARKVITDAGYGEYFGHGLGHGLGLDVHEGPYFNNLATDSRMESGVVMTVEPGVYIPGVGGVRIEDDVLVTDGGCRVLSNYPKGPDSAIIDVRAHAGAH